MKTLRIAILTNILPAYREGFYDRLFSRRDVKVNVYCQASIPGVDLGTIHSKYGQNVALVRRLSARHEKIAWQFLPVQRILSTSDVIFVGGNPRVLSDALFATLLSLWGKKMVLWTMARSYRGRRFTEDLRLAWTRLFRNILVYTDEEADYLRAKGFRRNRILGMNNGLDQNAIDRLVSSWTEGGLEEWRRARGLDDKILLLSCTRLEPKNRLDQVVDALPALIGRIPNLVWCVIGSGPQLPILKARIAAVGADNHVRFTGGLYDERELAPWFMSSRLLVHPAAVGLSLLHAFGYGLPAVVNDNPRGHGPEYAAFRPGSTGLAYRENDVKHLSQTVISLLEDERSRVEMGRNAYSQARDHYNVDIMVERFIRIAKEAYEDRRLGDPR